MTELKKSYQIRITTADGKSLLWCKQGQPALLPEELVDTWVSKFRPDIWEVTATGEMVGVGRSSEPTFKIVKVEKLAI
jgi:hypothetical protein